MVTKKIPRQGQTIHAKKKIPKLQKKNLHQQVGREYMKTYEKRNEKEAKQFWSKIWKRKEHTKKAE